MTNETFNWSYSEYLKAFKVAPHQPACIPEETIIEQLQLALEKGTPIPENYDWYKNLPPDANA